MTIMNLGDNIFICHKTGGMGEYAETLGEMSLELALWLEKRYYDHRLTEQSKRPDNTFNITDPDEVNRKQLQSNLELRDIDDRCRLSGTKHHRPALCTNDGHLTPLGLTKAKQAMAVIKDINDQTDDLAYRPDLWSDADDWLIKATIPVRSLLTLKIINKAIKDAEDRVEATKTDELADLMRIHQMQAKEAIETKDQKAAVQAEQDFLEYHRIEDFQRKIAQPDQDFKVVLLKTGIDPTTDNRPVLRGFVPTALLRQKARTDLNYLFKFGLVNLGAYRDGSIGRPKHIIFPAKAGIKVIDHLTRLGHLF